LDNIGLVGASSGIRPYVGHRIGRKVIDVADIPEGLSSLSNAIGFEELFETALPRLPVPTARSKLSALISNWERTWWSV
jgi:hypothetical protein